MVGCDCRERIAGSVWRVPRGAGRRSGEALDALAGRLSSPHTRRGAAARPRPATGRPADPRPGHVRHRRGQPRTPVGMAACTSRGSPAERAVRVARSGSGRAAPPRHTRPSIPSRRCGSGTPDASHTASRTGSGHVGASSRSRTSLNGTGRSGSPANNRRPSIAIGSGPRAATRTRRPPHPAASDPRKTPTADVMCSCVLLPDAMWPGARRTRGFVGPVDDRSVR